MLEQQQTELAQVQTRKWRVSSGRNRRADEVLVEPLRLFDLEAEAGDGGEFAGREVKEETDSQVVEPVDEGFRLVHRHICVGVGVTEAASLEGAGGSRAAGDAAAVVESVRSGCGALARAIVNEGTRCLSALTVVTELVKICLIFILGAGDMSWRFEVATGHFR